MLLAPGTRLGPYEIVEPLGAGGMGEVYRAHDPRLGRDVALKILPAVTANDPAALERFTREARAVAALNHPHIVTIHSTEEADGVRFMTMELIEGRTLDRVIPENGVSLARFFDVAIAMADALSAAHQKQITHRDLKPGNVMLTDSGQVKVLDFGLARTGDAAAATSNDATRAALTGLGAVVGTAAYMSPEQIEGKPLDGRSDLFALGVVMYELVTGTRPFRGDSSPAVMAAVMRDRPKAVGEVRPDVPVGVSRLVERCLEKNPRDRVQSAQEVLLELRALRRAWDTGTAGTQPAIVVPPRRSSRTAAAIAAVVVLSVLAGAAYLLLRSRTPREIAVSMTPITNSGQVTVAAVSPDGRYVAYVEFRDGKYAVFAHQIATGSSIQVLPPAENDYFGLTFSPDSSYIYAPQRATARLIRVASIGGPPSTVMEQVRSAVTFSPGAAQLAFGTFDQKSTSIVVANADGTNRRTLVQRPVAEGPLGRSVSWSPDGKTIATVTSAEIILVDAATGAQAKLAVPGWDAPESVHWTPGGDALIVTVEPVNEPSARHQILEVSYPAGRVTRLTNDLNDYHGATVSADGRTIAAVPLTVRSKLWIASLDTLNAAKQVPHGGLNDGAQGVTWAPDGRVAFADQTSVAWIVNADGSNLQPLTPDHGRARLLARCGPGKLTYMLPHGNAVSLYVIDPASGHPEHVVDLPPGLAPYPNCTPDGQWLVYTARRNLMKAPVAGGTPSLIAEQVHEGRVSPDGQSIAAHRVVPGQTREEIAIYSMADNSFIRALPGPASGNFQWFPDNSALVAVTTGDDDVSNFERIPIDGSPRTTISHLNATDEIHQLSVNPDGRIVFMRGKSDTDVILLKLGR